jgi:hypothetical protein
MADNTDLKSAVQKVVDAGLERAAAWAQVEAGDIDVTKNEFRKLFRELQTAKNLAPKKKAAPRKRSK